MHKKKQLFKNILISYSPNPLAHKTEKNLKIYYLCRVRIHANISYLFLYKY